MWAVAREIDWQYCIHKDVKEAGKSKSFSTRHIICHLFCMNFWQGTKLLKYTWWIFHLYRGTMDSPLSESWDIFGYFGMFLWYNYHTSRNFELPSGFLILLYFSDVLSYPEPSCLTTSGIMDLRFHSRYRAFLEDDDEHSQETHIWEVNRPFDFRPTILLV